MRYEVQMWINGEWVTQGWHGSLRMAGLQQAALQAAWANFEPSVRIWDAEEKRVVEAV